jgi:hypothetical protein
MSRFKDRMCAFGSCRETFEYRWKGLGSKIYCDKHSKVRKLFRDKKYYNDHREECKAQSRQWYKDNPRKTWSGVQLELRKKSQDKYRNKNKERIAIYQAQYFKENSSRIYETKKKWLAKKAEGKKL